VGGRPEKLHFCDGGRKTRRFIVILGGVKNQKKFGGDREKWVGVLEAPGKLEEFYTPERLRPEKGTS